MAANSSLEDLMMAGPSHASSGSPSQLNLGYKQLSLFDTIEVDVAPERKGLFIKHFEYQVTSRRLQSSVLRRYNDFFSFHEMLLSRYPYRLIPKLPPKKIVGATDVQFIEERRKCLKRWLTLVARHPIVGIDPLTNFFLTYAGPEVHHKIKEVFRNMPDEFTTSHLASQSKELSQTITATQLASSREQIRMIANGVLRLKQIADQMVLRSHGYAGDMADLGCQLTGMATDPYGSTEWGTGGNTVWADMKRGFHVIAKEFAQLSTKALQQGLREEEEVCEKLNVLLDVLAAHRQLCERHEKGVAQDHQKALDKMLALKKRQIQGVFKGTDGETVEQLEARMMEQESVIANVELRSAFSLHCMHLETQLVHAHFELLADVLNALVSTQVQGHSELAEVWQLIQPTVIQCLPENSSERNNVLSTFSPQ